MKRPLFTISCLFVFLFVLLISSIALATPPLSEQAQKGDAKLITVLNPLGQPPPVELIPMAPRLDTLEGKTVYLVDQGFGKPSGVLFLEHIQAWFAENMPSVTTIIKEKSGSYGQDDPELWQEIKNNGGDAVIATSGH